MLKTTLFILSMILLWGCELNNSPVKNAPKKMSYSYACLDSALGGSRVNKGLGKAGDIIRDLAVDQSSVTDDVQSDYGAAFHKDAVDNGGFVLLDDARINTDLRTTLQELLAAREQPSAIKYEIYALNDSAINAFTFGGRIYVTRKMYEKCGGKTALLYAIVGHEIGHSEKGHIKKTIQEMILSNRVFGENGATALQIKKLLTGSFNQKNELEADYYGTDLSYRLDQDVCAPVTFWREMSQQENQYSQLEDFFRSHPFSRLRAQCLQSHIRTNFGKDCQ